jgi:hypothetical protein
MILRLPWDIPPPGLNGWKPLEISPHMLRSASSAHARELIDPTQAVQREVSEPAAGPENPTKGAPVGKSSAAYQIASSTP